MRTLIQASTDPAQFEALKQKAEAAAGQVVYDRILGYKCGPRYRGGPYDYASDFGGQWLREFAVRSWRREEDKPFPMNLVEALRLAAL